MIIKYTVRLKFPPSSETLPYDLSWDERSKLHKFFKKRNKCSSFFPSWPSKAAPENQFHSSRILETTNKTAVTQHYISWVKLLVLISESHVFFTIWSKVSVVMVWIISHMTKNIIRVACSIGSRALTVIPDGMTGVLNLISVVLPSRIYRAHPKWYWRDVVLGDGVTRRLKRVLITELRPYSNPSIHRIMVNIAIQSWKDILTSFQM